MNGAAGTNWGSRRAEQFPHLGNYTLTPCIWVFHTVDKNSDILSATDSAYAAVLPNIGTCTRFLLVKRYKLHSSKFTVEISVKTPQL